MPPDEAAGPCHQHRLWNPIVHSRIVITVQRELDICPNPVRHEICDLQFNTTFMSSLVLYKVTQTNGNLFLRGINRGGGYCSNRQWQVNPVFEDEQSMNLINEFLADDSKRRCE